MNKITIKGNVKLIEESDRKYVIKNKNSHIKELYDYLNSSAFKSYPNLINKNREEYDFFEFIENKDIPIEQKGLDLIKLIGLLHNKTSFYKSISANKINTLRTTINNNLHLKACQKFCNNITGTENVPVLI